MSRVELPIEEIAYDGTEITDGECIAASADNHFLPNPRGRSHLLIKTGGTACNVTITPGYSRAGMDLDPRVIAIGINEEFLIKVGSRRIFNQRAGDYQGSVLIDVSEIGNVLLKGIEV